MTPARGRYGRHRASSAATSTADLIARGVQRKSHRPSWITHHAPPGTAIVHAPLDAAALRDAFAGVDAVVHLAGVVSAVDARAFTAVNVEGTRAVASRREQAGRASRPRVEPGSRRSGVRVVTPSRKTRHIR